MPDDNPVLDARNKAIDEMRSRPGAPAYMKDDMFPACKHYRDFMDYEKSSHDENDPERKRNLAGVAADRMRDAVTTGKKALAKKGEAADDSYVQGVLADKCTSLINWQDRVEKERRSGIGIEKLFDNKGAGSTEPPKVDAPTEKPGSIGDAFKGSSPAPDVKPAGKAGLIQDMFKR